MKIQENLPKSMKIHEKARKSTKINENQWNKKINPNPWIHENPWNSKHQCKSTKINFNTGKTMKNEATLPYPGALAFTALTSRTKRTSLWLKLRQGLRKRTSPSRLTTEQAHAIQLLLLIASLWAFLAFARNWPHKIVRRGAPYYGLISQEQTAPRGSAL